MKKVYGKTVELRSSRANIAQMCLKMTFLGDITVEQHRSYIQQYIFQCSYSSQQLAWLDDGLKVLMFERMQRCSVSAASIQPPSLPQIPLSVEKGLGRSPGLFLLWWGHRTFPRCVGAGRLSFHNTDINIPSDPDHQRVCISSAVPLLQAVSPSIYSALLS